MNWKLTEGMKRADAIVDQLVDDAWACGIGLKTMTHYAHYHRRMVEVVAQAIDKAIAYGATAGATEPWGDFEHAAAFPNGNGHADPVEQAEEGPGASAWSPFDENAVAPPANAALKSLMQNPPVVGGVTFDHETLKKKRGRPAGSKNKPKKAKGSRKVQNRSKAEPVAETADAPGMQQAEVPQ